MKKNLYSYHLDCGRMGCIDAVFEATTDEISDAIGKEVYFGEVLGKHSEVIDRALSAESITLLTDDADFILKAKQYCLVPRGYNPLECIDATL